MTRKDSSSPSIGRQRADGAERLVLLVVVDRHAVVRAVLHHRADQVREVADGKRQVGEAVAAQLLDDDLEDGALADREQRLGEHGRVGAQAGPLAAGQDDRSLPHLSMPLFGGSGLLVECRVEACQAARPSVRILGRIIYWLAVLAISVALLIALVMFFESRDDSSLEEGRRALESGSHSLPDRVPAQVALDSLTAGRTEACCPLRVLQ